MKSGIESIAGTPFGEMSHPHSGNLLPNSPELMPYFSRIGLMHYQRADLIIPGTRTFEQSDIEHSGFAREKEALAENYELITSVVNKHPECLEDPLTGWENLSDILLDKASSAVVAEDVDKQLNTILCAAISCALFTDSPEAKIRFIQNVYDRNLQDAMRKAMYQSPFLLMNRPPAQQRTISYSSFSYAFQASASDLKLILSQFDISSEPTIRPKIIQKELFAACKAGISTASREEEVNVSSRAESSESATNIEAWKTERYAMQHFFIEQQMHELFPNGTIDNSPLANLLVQKDQYPQNHVSKIQWLRSNMASSIKELTEPLIKRYRYDASIAFPEFFTTEQKIAQRFRKIQTLQERLNQVTRFVRSDQTVSSGAGGENIWSITNVGADVPARVEFLIQTICSRGEEHYRLTGEKLTADELYILALSKRKALQRLATKNFNEHVNLGANGAYEVYNQIQKDQEEQSDEFAIKRTTDGVLTIKLSFESDKFSNSDTKHEGATLGCPASKVAIEGLRQERCKDIHATNNFIDYLMEIMIKEAHRRKIFDIHN